MIHLKILLKKNTRSESSVFIGNVIDNQSVSENHFKQVGLFLRILILIFVADKTQKL